MAMVLKSTWRMLLAAVLSLGVVQGAQAERTTTYLHTDALGSVVAVSDESGNVLWRKAYAPYGQQIDAQPDDEALSYTGKPHDADLGLTYFGARYYDPVVGRFLSPDPVGFVADNPTSFNRYVYANNNPYRYVDPDGRYAVAVVKVLQLLGRAWSSIAGAIGGVYVAEEVIQPALSEADSGDPDEEAEDDFDRAREKAFGLAGMTDPDQVEITKTDAETGTAVEFKGKNGAKVGYDGPHASPGRHHDKQHISWQSGGKRSQGDGRRGNIPYSGPRHHSRPDRKDQ